MRSRPIRLDPHLHEVGEQAELPYPVVRALAWWVVAEMIRRHPDGLRVVETHPNGIYDCLSLFERTPQPDIDPLVAHLNMEGHITHRGPDGLGFADLDRRLNWYEVLAAQDRRRYVIEQLETAVGLSSPSATPETTSRSIGPRLLSRFAASAAVSNRSWRILHGYADGAWGDPVRTELFARFPGIRLEARTGGQLDRHPALPYWFIADHEGAPVAAFDLDRGRSWQPGDDGRGTDVLRLYRSADSAVDSALREVAPPVE